MNRKNKEIYNKIDDELLFACNKFPEWPTDPIHAAAILGEEAGEVLKATLQWVYEPAKGTTIEDIERELIQTAAMAIRMLRNFDHYDKDVRSFKRVEGE